MQQARSRVCRYGTAAGTALCGQQARSCAWPWCVGCWFSSPFLIFLLSFGIHHRPHGVHINYYYEGLELRQSRRSIQFGSVKKVQWLLRCYLVSWVFLGGRVYLSPFYLGHFKMTAFFLYGVWDFYSPLFLNVLGLILFLPRVRGCTRGLSRSMRMGWMPCHLAILLFVFHPTLDIFFTYFVLVRTKVAGVG